MSTTAFTRTPAPTFWGPAAHDPDHPLHQDAGPFEDGFDLRDETDLRPDDN